MSKYTAMPCAHCKDTFKEEDDIVVCPTCGAPHHRSCYREGGQCALTERHGDGFVWQAPIQNVHVQKDSVRCKHCGTVNPRENQNCQHCGTALQEEKPSFVQQSFAPHSVEPPTGSEFEVDGITAKEISAYVGNSAFYFLRQFQGLRAGKSISWNWFAFFFRYVYFFYRKMYAVGFAVLALSLPAMISSVLFSMEVLKANSMELFGVQVAHNAELLALFTRLSPLVNGYSLVLSIACGLYANRVYLRKVLTDIAALRKGGGNPAGGGEYYATLYMMGKPNFLAVLLIAAAFFFLYSSIGAHLVALMGL